MQDVGRVLARGRGPSSPVRIVAVLILAVGVVEHVPVAGPLAVGLAALVTVLSALWLRGATAVIALLAISAIALPWPLTPVNAVMTVAGGLLLTLAGRTVASLSGLMLAAQESSLRHAGARDELARR